MQADDLVRRLLLCPNGVASWKQFEDVCAEILTFLFVPPLTRPKIQVRTLSGIDRRDAIFPNRNFDTVNNWGKLYNELDARFVLVEFKNYDNDEIGKDEVNQTRNYMTHTMGKLALLCCSKTPNEQAHRM